MSHDSLFTKLYTRHYRYVREVLRKHGTAIRDIDDLSQDVFERVYRRLASYDPARRAESWLYGFAVRRASEYRSLARFRVELLGGAPRVVDDVPSVEEKMWGYEERALAVEAMGTLHPKLRTVLRLHDFEGLTMSQVVRELRMPLDTGYIRLRKARVALRNAIDRMQTRWTAGCRRGRA